MIRDVGWQLIEIVRNPELRFWGAVIGLGISLLAWPITQLTIARHEYPFTLALSWLAIIVTCVDIIATSDVRRAVD